MLTHVHVYACALKYICTVNTIASEFIHELLNMFMLARFHLGFGNILMVGVK